MRNYVFGTVMVFLLSAISAFSQCIKGDCFNGEGQYSYFDGGYYHGTFVEGKSHGYGIWCMPNGDKYVGYFKNDFQHGSGIVYHSDGTMTQGEWIKGEYFGTRGAEVEGCLEGDCTEGYGTYIYDEGNAKYTGYFKNEMPHGQGVCDYSNGEFYDGAWASGSFNGFGTLYLQDGSPVRGYWEDGTYVGKQEPTTPSVFAEDNLSANVSNTIQTLTDIRKNSKVKVHALIIGISTYTHMPVLKYSDDDAYRMYAFLKSPEGGALKDDQMRMLIDEEATRKNIKDAMTELFMNAGKDDLILMYYSGHGLKDCFLPIDFDRMNNKLFHGEINEILRRSPAKYKLCIADACHSGGLAMKGDGTGSGYSDEQIINTYYNNLAKSDAGTALILSSKLEEISLESSGLRQGVFSHFLIRGLEGEADRNYDKVVDVSELFEFISNNVKSYTANRQSPVIRGSFDRKMTVSVVR